MMPQAGAAPPYTPENTSGVNTGSNPVRTSARSHPKLPFRTFPPSIAHCVEVGRSGTKSAWNAHRGPG